MTSIEIKENVILDTGDYNIDEPPEYFKFKYEPDHFQKWGFKAISNNENILVTAHTGAGKTCLALYSIAKWLMDDDENQVIYTSPIKTLSNQKFKEFGEHFNSVGILTGDVKINPTANLLIMTAEILRNSLLRNCNEKVYEWNFNPEKVKCVILDEVHFINNPERGKVWEEIIANLNPSIQLVMLSATISGAENLASWVGKLKSKPCHLIPTPFRPVPLHHYLYYKNNLKCIKDNTSWKEGEWSEVITGLKKSSKGKFQKNKFNMGQLFESIEYCRNNDIMPVNVFLLNRSLTEEIAKKIPFNLLNHEESSEITKQWNKYLLKYRDIYQETEQWQFLLGLAQKGIGVHHSGIIPILKEIVEILYEQKLIKVLIATETFAMGVNMPTRTVIFTQTTKYDGKNSRPLRPEEYGQMAGRAGRRGIDTFGTVIILPENDMPSESEAKIMITSSPQQISSKLDIDYSFILKRMVLKLEDNNNESVVSYLSNSITNTMLADEISNVDSIHKTKLIELSKIDKYDNLSEYFEKFKELKYKENQIKIQQTSFVKLSNKILKRYNQEIKKLESEFGDKKSELEKWYKNFEKIKELENIIKCSQSRFDNQIKLILEFLIDYDIIYFEDDYKLTPLGRIVSEVNECNPIILGFIISNNYLDNLDFNEIVAFLSIFIADHSIEDPYLSDLNISKNFGEMLDKISDLADKMVCKETEINNQLPFNCWSNWDLHLSMFQVMLEWSKGDCKWNEVKHLYNTFEGNFCRNVLRLVNLLRNVESIALLINNANLLNKLDGYQEKLIRDIVIIDSLYL